MLILRPAVLFFVCIFLLLITLGYATDKMMLDFGDAWGNHGLSLEKYSPEKISLNFSLRELEVLSDSSDGERIHNLILPGVFLPNDEGAPNLPVISRFIALPQGAEAQLKIISTRTEELQNVNIEAAPRIPAGPDDEPLISKPDPAIYSRDSFFPENPIIISEQTEIRGLDLVVLSITPFQYNPVSKELLIYRDIKIEIDFIGGSGWFGEDRLRSKWFDPIINDLVINPQQIPRIDYSSRNIQELDGYEYLIVVPNDPAFIAWGDSIRVFRNRQGIKTDLVTTTEMGGNNHVTIKNYIQNNYIHDEIPPVAVLFLADYGTTGNTITSELRTDHPYDESSDYITDGYYADMTGNNLPDIITARITARDAGELETMVNKFIQYETSPPTNPHYYNSPITSLGWQTERWFQICAETISGFWENELGKQPSRQNAIYSGSPGSIWSTNTNTSAVLNVFGPNGTGYIPSSPDYLQQYGWNASANTINAAINSGAFMAVHRNHGHVTGWGTPTYNTSHISSLTNEDLIFVFSINCLTGMFNHPSTNCFAEVFHRHNYGALGVIAPTEVSYSFVNDTFVWGMFNNMWPNFLPDTPAYETEFGTRYILPAFAAAAGKWFLEGSSWPTNPVHKTITYRLFHHHGDAFTTVYTEMPQQLTVDYTPIVQTGATVFNIIADEGALIALSVDGEIIGTAIATGFTQEVSIEPQYPPSVIDLVITKQNYFRYQATISVLLIDGPYILYSPEELDKRVLPDGFSTEELRINNVGTANLNYNLSVTENWIGFQQISGMIPSMESHYIEVYFDSTPLSPGFYETVIVLTHNAQDTGVINIPVTLEVVVPELSIDPEAVDFGDVEEMNPVSIDFELSNLVEMGDIEVLQITVLGDNDNEFSFVSPSLPFIISGTETADLTVGFTPLSPGQKSAVLRIITDTGLTQHDIPLSGTGIPEVIGQPGNLTTGIFNLNNVELNWSYNRSRVNRQQTPDNKLDDQDTRSSRGLRGFNIHRNDQIIAELVSETTFMDYAVPNGTYTYQIEAVFFTTSTWSNTSQLTIDAAAPATIPFTENWNSGDFTANNWATGPVWAVVSNFGNPSPAARFHWSPSLTNYESSLTSWGVDAQYFQEVTVQFDLHLNNYSSTGGEWLSFEVYDGFEWQTIQSWNNTASIPWITITQEVSEYAARRVFLLRFRAHGANSWNINNWNIDNINVTGIETVVLDTPEITAEIVENIIFLDWGAIAGANSYRIYASAVPYPEEDHWVEIAVVSQPGFSESLSSVKRFYRVVASTEEYAEPVIRIPGVLKEEESFYNRTGE